MAFSVLMSVYRNDNPIFFERALRSVTIGQTLQPDELVLVVDGPVSDEIECVIGRFKGLLEDRMRVYSFEKNRGHGAARSQAVQMASNDWVAIMDADDIARPDRFELQMDFIAHNPECDIVGGQIAEFIGEEENIVGKRIVPCSNKDIYDGIRSRCPFNQMTVMMRREKVMAVGNYQDWHFNEDYWLWIRMAQAGCRFANLPQTLVNVRVGEEMYARRGGWKYFKSEKGLQDYMLRRKMIALPRYLFNVAVRFGVQVAMPNSLRGFIFRKLFRK